MSEAFDRPFPALTPAQRYYLEVFGYVIVENTLSRDECGQILDVLQTIKRELRNPTRERLPHEPYAAINLDHHVYMGGLVEADPVLTAFVSHPRLVSMAEELIGGEARLLEYDAHINSRIPGDTFETEPIYGFHRGTDVPFASHIKNDLYHCNFVKTLTMLTDVGEDDGGTVVIAGSHKVDVDDADIFECAYANRNLIHKVVAPAGSTLLFNETLIHATGQIKSDNERAIIIAGYGASMFPFWDNAPMSEEFTAQIPPQFQTLFGGKAHWTRGARYRNLSEEVDPRAFTLADGYWPSKENKSVV